MFQFVSIKISIYFTLDIYIIIRVFVFILFHCGIRFVFVCHICRTLSQAWWRFFFFRILTKLNYDFLKLV